MPGPGSLIEPDSLEATTPLAWAIGGPKDDGTPGHPALNQANADQIFILEGKVIDMKWLEQIKKRLSKGIDLRIAKDGTLTFRARFRRKGQPLLSQTFTDPKLAEHWLQEQKRSALIGLHLPEMKTKTITFKEAVDRYIKSILPLKPKNAHNSKRHLLFWVKELGDRPLFSITPEQIEQSKKLWSGLFTSDQELSDYFDLMSPLYANTPFSSNNSIPFSHDVLNHGFSTQFQKVDFTGQLSRIKCPTLIIVGEQEWICSIEDSEELSRRIPNSQLLILKAGHLLELDASEPYFSAIEAFMKL